MRPKARSKDSANPAETERELREFIEDHAAEIQGTEVGEIPRILDYREWFRYELKVMTSGADGVVMDRKVKSIGSGGEQAVPNYLLILTIAHFLYDKDHVRLPVLIFDEAFYGIDAGRRDQLLGFASDLDLQLFVASPDQDGVKREVAHSTSVLVVKNDHLCLPAERVGVRCSILLGGLSSSGHNPVTAFPLAKHGIARHSLEIPFIRFEDGLPLMSDLSHN